LRSALLELESAIRDTGVSQDYLVPDLVAIGLSREVFENGHAVLLLAESNVPRTVHPNSRAAFEAAQDLILLVTAPDYDTAGSEAYVAEVFDKARSRELAEEAFTALGRASEIEHVDVDSVLKDAADTWAGHAPAKAELIFKAKDVIAEYRRRRKYHWSGLTRDEIHRELGTRMKSDGTAEIYKSMYNILSFSSHPSPRLDEQHLSYSKGTGFTLQISSEDPVVSAIGIDAAIIAVKSTTALLVDVRDHRGAP
jgi:hypothetical protein